MFCWIAQMPAAIDGHRRESISLLTSQMEAPLGQELFSAARIEAQAQVALIMAKNARREAEMEEARHVHETMLRQLPKVQ